MNEKNGKIFRVVLLYSLRDGYFFRRVNITDKLREDAKIFGYLE